MLKHTVPIALLLVTAAAVPAIAPGQAFGRSQDQVDAQGHPACNPGDVVDNDDLRIWFHGAKFQLKVFKKNASTGAVDGKYQYKSMEIVELNETNATVATLNLENAEPQDSTCTVVEEGDWINVTYTANETVQTPGDDGPPSEEATVEFVYHFNKTNASSKFDLNVQEWPWHEGGEELAYAFDVTSDWQIEPAENGLGFRDQDDGEAEAFITWAPNATAKYEDGHNETAIVDSNTTGSDHHTTTVLRFTQATPGYVELDYDPEVAVGPYLILADVLVPVQRLPAPVRSLATALA